MGGLLKYRVFGGVAINGTVSSLYDTFAGRSSKESRRDPTNKLSSEQKELIASAIGVSILDRKSFAVFEKMPPAVRELRIANAVSAKWGECNFAEADDSSEKARAYSPEFLATIERYEAAARTLISDCGLEPASALDRVAHIKDPSKLTAFQKLVVSKIMLVAEDKISPKTMVDFFETMRKIPEEERKFYWKNCVLSLVTLGDLAHKLQYGENLTVQSFNRVEQELIASMLGKSSFVESDLPQAKTAIKLKDVETSRTTPISRMKLVQLALMSAPLGGTADDLWQVAQLANEYQTMLDFAGLLSSKMSFSTDSGAASVSSIGQDHARDGDVCQDSMVSVKITRNGSDPIYIDAVFDGMGGHSGGRVASTIASSTLGLCAAIGLITNPEEARRALVLSDFAIFMKTVVNRRLSGMGTTAAASFVRGREFYGLHTGDASYTVYLDENILFKSIEHSPLVGLAIASYKGANPWESLSFAEKYAYLTSEDAINAIKPYLGGPLGVDPGSALGTSTAKIEINNSYPGPVILPTNARVLVQSDGTGDIVSDAEEGQMISQSDSLLAALRDIHSLAMNRSDQKEDDKSMLLRQV